MVWLTFSLTSYLPPSFSNHWFTDPESWFIQALCPQQYSSYLRGLFFFTHYETRHKKKKRERPCDHNSSLPSNWQESLSLFLAGCIVLSKWLTIGNEMHCVCVCGGERWQRVEVKWRVSDRNKKASERLCVFLSLCQAVNGFDMLPIQMYWLQSPGSGCCPPPPPPRWVTSYYGGNKDK